MKGLHATAGKGWTGQGGYEPPAIRDHGTLTQITADQGMLFDVTRASVSLMAAAVSTPLVPGGNEVTTAGTSGSGTPGSGALDPSTTTSSPAPSAGGVLEEAGSGSTDPSTLSDPGGTAGDSGSGGGTGGGGGSGSGGDGGRLPFTGLAVVAIAAVGAAATGTGAAMRRMLRRDKAPGAGQ